MIRPEYIQKGPFTGDKRYAMEGYITKSGKPNRVSIYVKEGSIQEIRLDKTGPIPAGTVVLVEATVSTKAVVTQASFVAIKTAETE